MMDENCLQYPLEGIQKKEKRDSLMSTILRRC